MLMFDSMNAGNQGIEMRMWDIGVCVFSISLGLLKFTISVLSFENVQDIEMAEVERRQWMVTKVKEVNKFEARILADSHTKIQLFRGDGWSGSGERHWKIPLGNCESHTGAGGFLGKI